MAKLLENTYRHVNIALVNEMAMFCHELGIDLWDVIQAARPPSRSASRPFYPGPGVGGHCIPIDPNYLSYKVRASSATRSGSSSWPRRSTRRMPGVRRARRAQNLLNERRQAGATARTVLLLGVTYKPDIADQRESPAAPLARRLAVLGAELVLRSSRT